jgi:hypothetical protein
MGNYENIDVTFEEVVYPFNYNPIHALWRCLKMVGLPETRLDSDTFLAASITVYNEATGVSLLMRDHQASLVYIKSLLAHVTGLLYHSNNGKLCVKLIRDDYNVDDLVIISVDNLLDDPMLDRGSWMETVGEISVQYNQITNPSEEAFE